MSISPFDPGAGGQSLNDIGIDWQSLYNQYMQSNQGLLDWDLFSPYITPQTLQNAASLNNYNPQFQEGQDYSSLPDSDPLKINWEQNQLAMQQAANVGGYQNDANIAAAQEARYGGSLPGVFTNGLEKWLPPVTMALAGYGVGAGIGAAAGATGGGGGGAAAGGGSAAGSTVGSTTGTLASDIPTVVIPGTVSSGLGAGAGAAIGGAAGAALPTGGGGFDATNTVQVNGTPTETLGIDPGYIGGATGGSLGIANTNPLDPNYNPGADTSPNMSNPTNSGGNNPLAGFDWTNLIGPIINGLGSYLGGSQANSSAKDAAALAINASRPFNVNIPGVGSSAFDMNNRTATINPADVLGQFQGYGANLATQGYNGLAGGLPNVGGFGGISPQLNSLFENYKGSGYQAPGANVYGSQSAYNGLLSQAGANASSLLGQAQGISVPDRAAGYLNALNSQAGFAEGQATQNNLESQFGKGILASTAGAYQTQALNNTLQQNLAARQMQAQQMALNDQTAFTNNAGSALGQFQNLQQTGFNQGYQNNLFGNTAINQMFGNALNLFGAGQMANQQSFGQNNALYNQGQANNLGVGNYLSGLLGVGGNLGSLASGAAGQGAGILAQNGVNQGNLIAGFLNNLGSSVDWSKLFGNKS